MVDRTEAMHGWTLVDGISSIESAAAVVEKLVLVQTEQVLVETGSEEVDGIVVVPVDVHVVQSRGGTEMAMVLIETMVGLGDRGDRHGAEPEAQSQRQQQTQRQRQTQRQHDIHDTHCVQYHSIHYSALYYTAAPCHSSIHSQSEACMHWYHTLLIQCN
jgi:hypothetical protein